MSNIYFGLLVLILLISLTVRIVNITSVPPALYWDEMDAGYQAYSILKTGKDYFGNTPGLIIQSFADFRAPVLIYTTIPFVAFLGLDALSVRLPAALFGAISVLLVYFLCLELFKSKKTGLIAAFLVALSPWNIQYSRMAFESTLMLSLFLGGLITFLKALNNSRWWILSAILFGLSILTYNTAKLFIPLLLIVLFLLYIKIRNQDRFFWIGVFIFGLIFLSGLYSSFFQGGGRRFSEISVFTDPQVNAEVDNSRRESWVAYSENKEPGFAVKAADVLFFNKFTFFAGKVFQNYLQAFSPDFLFINGDPNLRHSPSEVGELYPVELTTIVLGLILLGLSIKQKRKENIFILLWILMAPIPAIITRDGGTHATRLFFLFPALNILSALGLSFLFQSPLKKINKFDANAINKFDANAINKFDANALKAALGVLVIAILSFNIGFFMFYYFGTYKIESTQSFQYGFSEGVKEALSHAKKDELVIIDDRKDSALMNYLFDNKYDPGLFQSQIKTLAFELEGIKSARIGNVIFLDPQARVWPTIFKNRIIDENFVLAVSAEQLEEQTASKVSGKLTKDQKLLETIYYKSGVPAFYIIKSTASIQTIAGESQDQ